MEGFRLGRLINGARFLIAVNAGYTSASGLFSIDRFARSCARTIHISRLFDCSRSLNLVTWQSVI